MRARRPTHRAHTPDASNTRGTSRGRSPRRNRRRASLESERAWRAEDRHALLPRAVARAGRPAPRRRRARHRRSPSPEDRAWVPGSTIRARPRAQTEGSGDVRAAEFASSGHLDLVPATAPPRARRRRAGAERDGDVISAGAAPGNVLPQRFGSQQDVKPRSSAVTSAPRVCTVSRPDGPDDVDQLRVREAQPLGDEATRVDRVVRHA